jgi:predicted transcriptional regulator
MESDLFQYIKKLQEENEALKLQVAEESKEKYQLYKRIKDLTESKDPIY